MGLHGVGVWAGKCACRDVGQGALGQRPPEVAVGDDAANLARVVLPPNHRGPIPCLGHGFQHVGQGGVPGHCRFPRRVHQGCQGPGQLFAQASSRVVGGKVLRLEGVLGHQRDGQCVAHGELKGGAGGGGEVQGTSFFWHGHVQHDAGGLAQRRPWVSRQGDKGTAPLGEGGQKLRHFIAAAAFGQAHHHVPLLHRPEVAVQGLTCVQEHRGTACGVERGRDFGCDVGTFADAGHHDFPDGCPQQPHRLVEVIPHAVSRLAQRLGGQRQRVFAGMGLRAVRHIDINVASGAW